MEGNYQIKSVEKPDNPIWEVVGGGIHNYNIQQAGDGQDKMLCYILFSPENEVVGGLIGQTHWEWFYINLMFIKEDLRGQGYGHQLLTLSEEEARRRGAKHAYLDTFSFQAPGFYQKHGYRVFGELGEFPPGHTRYYLRKEL
jgi:GNAT superfamily N-acetyltransferase